MRNLAARQAMMGGGGETPSPVPSEYEIKEYVYSDGIAYIIIPHNHTNSLQIQVKTQITALSGFVMRGKNVFQGAVNDTNWLGGFYGTDSVQIQGYIRQTPYFFQPNPSLVAGTTIKVYFKSTSSNTIYYEQNDDEGVYVTTTGSFSACKYGLFTQTNGNNAVSGRVPKNIAIHAFYYEDPGSYIAKLVPVQHKSTGICGFYDIENSMFLGNSNSSGTLASGGVGTIPIWPDPIS